MPDAVPAVIAYDAVRTQWLRGGSSGARTGLNYTACLPVLRLLLERWEQDGTAGGITELELLEDLQTIETAVMEVDMERAEQNRGGP